MDSEISSIPKEKWLNYLQTVETLIKFKLLITAKIHKKKTIILYLLNMQKFTKIITTGMINITLHI